MNWTALDAFFHLLHNTFFSSHVLASISCEIPAWLLCCSSRSTVYGTFVNAGPKQIVLKRYLSINRVCGVVITAVPFNICHKA